MSEKKIDTRKTITLRLSPEMHKALKVYCAEKEVNIQKFIEELVQREIEFGDGGGVYDQLVKFHQA